MAGSDKGMTTANKITILRILLVPFFVGHLLYYTGNGNEWHRLIALSAFSLAVFSDAIDGYIARKFNQFSELGAIMDPLADKLLLVLGLVLLSQNNRPYLEPIPLWLVVSVFSRDVILLLGLVLIYYTYGRITVQPYFIGKVATVLQMTTIFWALLKWDKRIMDWIAGGATISTIISGILYIHEGIKQLSASPTSAPTQKP